jgi:DNA-directed RNA polymerase II subunit RPB2
MESGICQTEQTVASLADSAATVLQRYFDGYPNTFLTQHHIQSYEAFVFRELPDIIKAENPITILKQPYENSDIYKYKVEIFIDDLDVATPIIQLDGGKTMRRMFPNEARIRDLTYAASFLTTIRIRVTFTVPADPTAATKYTSTVKELKYTRFPLFRLPILLRSRLCATYEADKNLLWEMGECRNDMGGYFIVDGSEKVLITRQEQAFNSVYVAMKPPHDLKLAMYASVVCQHPDTKQTRRVAVYRLHESMSGVEEGAIRVSIPFVKGTIPLFVLFRALGVESDREIVRMILPDTSAPTTPEMENKLIASIHDAWPITTHLHAIEFIRTLTKGFVVATVLDIMKTHLFCHVPDRPLARAQYLAEIVRKMIRVEMGLEPATNRDDIRNQRLLPTGTLLRGLFSEAYQVWKKAVSFSVDKLYNYNKSLYQDDDFMTIFSSGNISHVMDTAPLNDAILRGFRGKWGTNQYNMKSGVIQPLARISYLDAMSHTRRVVSDFDTSMKLTGPRHLNPSQVGYFCTAETPTGSHIGATRNLSILTAISIGTSLDRISEWLLSRGGILLISAAPTALAATATTVQINGGTLGFTTRPDTLVKVLKCMKWTACLPPTTSISFNTTENILRVYCDDGRPLRPLWHLGLGGAWPTAIFAHKKDNAPLPSWRELVCGTLPLTSSLTPYSAEFLDPLAANPNPSLEDYLTALQPYIGAIEYVDPYEGNEAYIDWWGTYKEEPTDYTHAEIHPSTLLGLLGSMIPFANHNQSPRNQLSCSQSKQGIGYYATNYESRFDTYGSMLCYGEGAMCRTIVHEAVAGGAMPYGSNIIFCINSFNGYNQDDGILFNRSSIERGLFRSLALRSYTTVEEMDPISKSVYRIGNPKFILTWSDLKPGNDYSELDEYGVIKEGTKIHDKTVLVGRYMTNAETGKITDSSLLPTVFTKGTVDKVVVLHMANGMRLVRVRILEERVPELGDKFSSRHGQKGTMGMLLDAQDMPRTAEGLVPDVIVNPHCIPSRMTIAQLLEQVFGKLGAVIGAKMNATSFMNDEQSYNAIADALETIGLQRNGEEILYSGMTGKMFSSSVFMGPLYFMRLKHLTQDKINSRAAGRKEIRTHQPTGGRGNEGGMRIGEMERDVLIAHGTMGFLQESMMKRSDGTSFYVCNGCGTMPIYNEANQLFICSMCDGPLTFQGDTAETIGLVLPVRKSRSTFTKVEMPYAMKLLDQELTTFMNAGLRFLTAKQLRKFREPTDLGLNILEDVDTAEAIEKQIDEGMEAAAKVAELPPTEMGDTGAEDAAEDAVDEGAPARNEIVAVEPVPAGVPVIEFYSKTPQYKELSNFHSVQLTLEGKVWPSVEHYFQAMKFSQNPDYQETIRLAKTPSIAKRLGKTRDVLIRADWNTYRDTVMYTALKEKFSERHSDLRDKLLATGEAILKEASPMDNYWGIGRSKKGQNKMGILLMKIREELKMGPQTQAGLVAPAVDEDIAHAVATQEEAALPPPQVEPVATQAAPAAPVAPVVPQAAPAVPQAAPVPPAVPQPVPQQAVVPAPQAALPPVPFQAPATAWTTVPGPLAQPAQPTQPQAGPMLNIQEVSAEELPPAEDSNVKVITLNGPMPAQKK